MKKFIPYLLIFICLGCDDLFHEEEISIGKIESAEELESAVDGVWARLADIFTGDDARYEKIFTESIKGDDLSESSATYSYYYGYEENCSGFSGVQSHSWSVLYNVVISSNNIISQFNPAGQEEKEIKRLLGETYLLRAYCYFRLTRTYGRIPLIRDIEINYTTPLSTLEEIYSFIESDLLTAMKLLPESSNETRHPYGTPHRGTAKALLAEVYLSWAGYPVKDETKYTRAAREAGEVIDSAGFFGFSLEEDFAHVWDDPYRYNPETVLALFFADPASIDEMTEINTYYFGRYYEHETTLLTHPDSLWMLFWRFATEINFYNRYPKSYRKDITFFTTIYVPGEYSYRQIDTGYVYVDIASSCARPVFRKFFYSPSLKRREYGDFALNNFYGNSKISLFRYAHTLLTYSEAMARSGQLTSEAYEAVNQIRRRAYHVDIHSASPYDIPSDLSTEAFADSVVQERAWELAGEFEGRWFDLVRLERVEELEHTRHPLEGGFPQGPVTKDDYFLSIPEEDQILNPNLGD